MTPEKTTPLRGRMIEDMCTIHGMGVKAQKAHTFLAKCPSGSIYHIAFN